MYIEVNIDKSLEPFLKRVKKNINWGMTRTLTVLAQTSQKEIQEEIPKKFDTTKRWWSKNQPTGIKIKPAKRQKLKSSVYVGDKNNWLARHEFGDPRKAQKKALIIPVYKKNKNSPDKKDKKFRGITRETWKKATGASTAFEKYTSNKKTALTPKMKAKKYPFVLETKKGDVLIKRKKGDKFKPLFTKKKRTKPMTKRLGFYNTVEHTVETNLHKVFTHELTKALTK